MTSGHGLNAQNDQPISHMWVRIGAIDGLRYLSKHFQIVIFSRDSDYEDLGQPYSQIQMIQSYLNYNDIIVDGIYGQQQSQVQMEKDGADALHTTGQPAPKSTKNKDK